MGARQGELLGTLEEQMSCSRCWHLGAFKNYSRMQVTVAHMMKMHLLAVLPDNKLCVINQILPLSPAAPL